MLRVFLSDILYPKIVDDEGEADGTGVVLRAGAEGVSSVTDAAVSMNAVDVKSGGLVQPE